jgi:hypothetical protein
VRRRAAALLALLLGVSVPVVGAPAGEERPGFRLEGVRLLAAPLAVRDSVSPPGPPALPPDLASTRGARSTEHAERLLDSRTARVSAAVLAAVPIAGWLTWWREEDGSSFHLRNEGGLGRYTYAGGADKAAHFVMAAMAEDGAEAIYRSLGKDERTARLLGVGLVSAAGLVIEIGDGFTKYGASWEDAGVNLLGALTAASVKSLRLEDTIGFRFGVVRARVPDPCCRATAYGGDYSRWVHSVDLKLDGLLPRLGIAPGPARYLLVSLTYGSKGYRFSPVEARQRNVGIDLGLNVEQLLLAAGVRADTWWGRPLLLFARYYRIPWTAFGWRYDLNSGRWHGPDTGDRFDPGAVVYD